MVLLGVVLAGGLACRGSRSGPGLTVVLPDGGELNRRTIGPGAVFLFWSPQSPPSQVLQAEVARLAELENHQRIRFFSVVAGRSNPGGPPPPATKGLEAVQDTNRLLTQKFGIEVVPTIVVLDSDCRVTARLEGYSPAVVQTLETTLIELGKRSE